MPSSDTKGEVASATVPDVSDLRWECLGLEHVGEVYRIHLAARQSMQAGTIRPDEEDCFSRVLEDGGALIGCRDASGTLAGYGVVEFDSPIRRTLADLLSLGGDDEARLAVFNGAALLPAWRGLGIYAELLTWRIRHARSRKHSLLAVTVSPQNAPCLRALERGGFQVARTARLYGGHERLILLRDLRQEAPTPDALR